MPQALIGGGAFLCAVLWMNLMFDVQAMNQEGVLPTPVLEAVAAHYRQVTHAAAPMGNVVSLVAILAVLGAVLQLSRTTLPLWLRLAALMAVLVPVVYAFTVIVPAAVRLGGQADPAAVQSELARAILAGNLTCLVFLLTFTSLQVLAVQRLRAG